MDTLPLFLHLGDQRCVVVGGGAVAARKVELLARTGARITVVAPDIAPAITTLAEGGAIAVERRRFEDDDVRGALLVVAATGDRQVNRAVHAVCRARGVLINTVDDPALCTASFPSIVDRGPVTVAVSTGGMAPAFARHLRERLEAFLPAGLGRLATFLGGRRANINRGVSDSRARRRLWDRVLDGPIPGLVEAGAEDDALAVLERLVRDPGEVAGFVSLVGAGPGDPDLLTIKALRVLQRADLVYYDNLVSEGVLDRCRRDAERIYVGKRRAYRGRRQAEINELLVASARDGHRVVRLKGGDPFVFGRGGEEIETLRDQGVPFEVVPGITAALGCAAYAGIPLTHRDWAQSVRFVTGHMSGGEVNLRLAGTLQGRPDPRRLHGPRRARGSDRALGGARHGCTDPGGDDRPGHAARSAGGDGGPRHAGPGSAARTAAGTDHHHHRPRRRPAGSFRAGWGGLIRGSSLGAASRPPWPPALPGCRGRAASTRC